MYSGGLTMTSLSSTLDFKKANLEFKQRAKVEALRIKENLEEDVSKLEAALTYTNKSKGKAQKATILEKDIGIVNLKNSPSRKY